jgi:predicted Zn-dependent protease
MASQSGTIHGLVLYIELGGSVYEVAGYAATMNWPAYSAVIGQALASFRGLSDARYLDVAPHRIRIVRLPTAMSLTEFMQRYPSTVGADQVQLINQVSASERLAAGRLLKQVTGGRVPAQ